MMNVRYILQLFINYPKMDYKKIKSIIKIEDYTIPNIDITGPNNEDEEEQKFVYKMSDNYKLPEIGSTRIITENIGRLINGKDLYQESRYERLLLADKDVIKKTFVYYTIEYIKIEKKKKTKKPKRE